ncbi:hypothetical protein [Pseudoalteromonas byunsanensis]|uniref:Uncharacterized protein n=1 Tax=Pseudoalteromonas byunsanensis TaxID=327939 RepID=A0A1S1N9Y2_9GAMM|nr:hypothetical protein [Pseudoalteromonas byunsanensis]OHU96819.1 hypothetical protein BIW53_05725 [Pseudoalteromonas byunsanensis]
MVQADSSGQLTGRFTIPPQSEVQIPAGTKSVIFQGEGGSRGTATYTSSGQIRTETLAQVTTITTERFDPLAQTFTLQQSRFIAAVELFFTAKGEESVQVQIREVVQGIPTQTVLAQSRVQSSAISLTDATLFSFTPVLLQSGQEYAIVVLTDGAAHEVAIAELGKYDQQHGWVTSQPYQVGVLLSSSNASTWTPHQDKDLTFNLKAAKFTSTQRTVNLGDISVTQASDLMALAVVQRPSSDTSVNFTLTGTGGSSADSFTLENIQEWTPQQLTKKFNGNVNVRATLSGSSTLSPVLFAGSQCAAGEVMLGADYISRQISYRVGGRFTVSFEAVLQDSATVEVQLEQDDGSWLTVPLSVQHSSDNGWRQYDYVHSFAPSSEQDPATKGTRVKLLLVGTAANRPRIANLRAFST